MARRIAVEIVGDEKDLLRAFKKSEQASNRFAGSTKKTGRSLTRSVVGLTGAFVGTAGLASAASAAFGEMAEGQKVAAQTRAVIKSTGRAANVTAKDIDKLGDRLLRVSGVDDELIKSGANVLLTFKKIRNEAGKGNRIFDRAAETILDMSVALGTDMQSAAIQVGKALNDPVRGLSTLRRVGVSFTDAQEDQIEALVKSGKTMEAQKIILRELQTEFGGSAKAAGETLPGKLNILRESLLNLGGTIAEKLAPSIEKLVDKIVRWLDKSQNQERVMKAVEDAAAALAGVLGFLRKAFKVLNDITGSTTTTLKLLFGVLVAYKTARLAATIGTIAKSFGLVGTNAGLANVKAGKLLATMRLLGRIGTITILVELILNKGKIDSFLKKHGLGFSTKSGVDLVGGALGAVEIGGGGRKAPRADRPSGLRGPRVAGGVSIDTVNVYGVQNKSELMKELQKEGRRRSHTRRGPNAGNSLGFAG